LQIPQTREGAAHGGLAQPDIGRRPGNVAAAQQRVQGGNEVEVETSNIHFTHDYDHINAFQI
jgi:hypothetical protein